MTKRNQKKWRLEDSQAPAGLGFRAESNLFPFSPTRYCSTTPHILQAGHLVDLVIQGLDKFEANRDRRHLAVAIGAIQQIGEVAT